MSEAKPVVEYHSGSVWFVCPGCNCYHRAQVDPSAQLPKPWTWNRDLVKPTLSPSLLVMGKIKCHLYVRNGVLEFLGDSEHQFAGKNVTMEPTGEE